MSLQSNNPKKLPLADSSLESLHIFSQIKLIVLDLDGTLLKTSNDLPGIHAKNLVGKVDLILATGRTVAGTQKILEELALNHQFVDSKKSNYSLILYNGSLVIEPNKNFIIYHQEISYDDIVSVSEISGKNFADMFVYIVHNKNNPFTINPSKEGSLETVFYKGVSPMPKTEFNGMPVQGWSKSCANMQATAILILPTSKSNTSTLIDALNGIKAISITSSGGGYIEVRPFGSSKAKGLEHWVNLPSVSYRREEILAIGDNDNDVELLEWAGIGVAVSSASDAALGASDFVTNYGARDGVIELLTLVTNAKRYLKNMGKLDDIWKQAD